MRWYYCLPFLFIVLFGLPLVVSAHGAHISYTTGTAVQIAAAFDSGEPMAGAQVTVFAPDDPATAWMTGTCDQAGRFTFLPDPAMPGNWEVQVRLAGHGDIVVIPVDATSVAGSLVQSDSHAGYSPFQIVIMSASVVWGFIGTALFFAGRKQ